MKQGGLEDTSEMDVLQGTRKAGVLSARACGPVGLWTSTAHSMKLALLVWRQKAGPLEEGKWKGA
jgi:hypothetical protein